MTTTERAALAKELGFWPASTDPQRIAELRAQNARYDEQLAQDPEGTKHQKMSGALRRN